MEIEKYIVSSDAGLADMVLGGDNRAFGYLFDRYGGALHKLYLGRTGNADDTNDLIQEIFIKAFLHIDSYNSEYAFGQWIYTIARNTFIDYVRKRREDLSIDGTHGEYVAQPASPAPDPEEKIIRKQQRTQLEGHLLRMSPKYRTLIELRFFKDLSYEQIALRTGLPLGTVKTQIHRARAKLCDSITKSGI